MLTKVTFDCCNNCSNRMFNSSIQKNKSVKHHKTNPSFSGLYEFAEYGFADILAIVLGCGAVDSYFKSKAASAVRKFGQYLIKHKYAKEMDNIDSLVVSVYKNCMASRKQRGLAKKLKKVYEEKFDRKLPITQKSSVSYGHDTLSQLKNGIGSIFIQMDNPDRFSSIGKPVLDILDKIN